jgi:hypothetical protein
MSSVKVVVKPYKNKELRAMYGMDENPKAWKKYLDRYKDFIGERKGQFYDVHQVRIIFLKLGVPGVFLSDELEKRNSAEDKAA